MFRIICFENNIIYKDSLKFEMQLACITKRVCFSLQSYNITDAQRDGGYTNYNI